MTHLALSDPRVAGMPTFDNGEGLVPLHGIEPKLLIDDSAENRRGLGYAPEFLVRESVAAKLATAAHSLPVHRCLLVKESLRPRAFQEFIFHRRLSRLSMEHPELAQDALVALTSKFVAPPWVAGHPTGGAIDVTLCDGNGRELDLGCAYDADEKASQGRCFSFAENLPVHATQNRSILFACLGAQGFINYPFRMVALVLRSQVLGDHERCHPRAVWRRSLNLLPAGKSEVMEKPRVVTRHQTKDGLRPKF